MDIECRNGNTKYKIGICEDEEAQKEYLARMVLAYYEGKGRDVEVETFGSAEQLLFRYPAQLPFSCVLLDIKLKEINGMELAKRIRREDKDIPIIFITGDRDYALDGYKVGAVRYLLKPYYKEDLFEALDCVGMKEMENEDRHVSYFCFNYNGEFIKIRVSDILYAEVSGHYISLNTKEQKYFFKESIKNIRSKMPEDCFVQVSRSVIVNLQNVERITRKECTLCDGSVVSVSRGCYEELNNKFVQYYDTRVRKP